MSKNDIGKNCFYKGYEVQIVGQNGPKHWIIAPVEKLDPNTDTKLSMDEPHEINCYSVNKYDCHRLITDEFELHDSVKSTIGTFVGTITGFELSTNRAVCISDAIDRYKDNRTRYAYTVYEIDHYDRDEFVFEQGVIYKINKNTYRAVSCSGHLPDAEDGENYIALVHTANHSIDYPIIPKFTSYSTLSEIYGIDKIERNK